jgi:hypothetical protein
VTNGDLLGRRDFDRFGRFAFDPRFGGIDSPDFFLGFDPHFRACAKTRFSVSQPDEIPAL